MRRSRASSELSGRRVRLTFTSDPWTKLRPGTLGTVIVMDDSGTLHVKWDDGSNLGLIPDCDNWEILPDEKAT